MPAKPSFSGSKQDWGNKTLQRLLSFLLPFPLFLLPTSYLMPTHKENPDSVLGNMHVLPAKEY